MKKSSTCNTNPNIYGKEYVLAIYVDQKYHVFTGILDILKSFLSKKQNKTKHLHCNSHSNLYVLYTLYNVHIKHNISLSHEGMQEVFTQSSESH